MKNKKNINFHKLVDKLFQDIENKLNLYENQIDIDYEIQNYVFTIFFSNNSVIIINKQEPLRQVWMATKINGYHFDYINQEWICTRNHKTFWEIFQNAFSMQLNKKFNFDN